MKLTINDAKVKQRQKTNNLHLELHVPKMNVV